MDLGEGPGGPGLFQGEGEDQEVHRDGEEDDGEAEGETLGHEPVQQTVEEPEDRAQTLDQRPEDLTHQPTLQESGTGS